MIEGLDSTFLFRAYSGDQMLVQCLTTAERILSVTELLFKARCIFQLTYSEGGITLRAELRPLNHTLALAIQNAVDQS